MGSFPPAFRPDVDLISPPETVGLAVQLAAAEAKLTILRLTLGLSVHDVERLLIAELEKDLKEGN